MKPPQLHLPTDVALEYANGNSSEAISLAAACHLTFCAHCRSEVATCERMAEALLESLPGVPIDPERLQEVLAKLDELPPPAPRPSPPPRALPTDLQALPLPAPLRKYVEEAPSLRWRTLAPGVRAIDLPLREPTGATARLLRFRPGFTIPLHDHAGAELTLVLSGGIKDEGQLAEAGDVLPRSPGERHIQQVTQDEECVALVVNEGPLVPLTLKGRLLKFITGV